MVKVVRTPVEVEGTTYHNTVVVEGEPLPPWTADARLGIVGRATPRIDGPERVTGRAVYTSDVRLPGMLHAKILRCPHAHARLKRIDVSRAARLPGVRTILAHRNAPAIPWMNGALLFDETLRFEGDEVAAVAADDEAIAQDALELIEVEYEPLPFVIDPEDALRPDAPRIHLRGNVSARPRIYTRGDVDLGFDRAEVVVEEVIRTQTTLHNSFEPHCCVAQWEGDELTIWESTQYVHGVREQVAQVLGLPLHRVRCICEYMGGGFGSKQQIGKYTIIAALLARRAGRPVSLVLDRREENLAAGNRHPTVQWLRIGAKRDGTLTAMRLHAIAAVGAYGGEPMAIAGPVQELYQCPNVYTEEIGVFTNTGPTRAFRAPGYAEGMYALEVVMDALAESLGIDPLELRLRNYAATDAKTGHPFSSKPLREIYREGAAQIAWHEKRRPETSRAAPANAARRRGVGMATQIWGGGGGPPAYALVRLNPDASVDVVAGTQDIGTGTRTVLGMIAAEELGLPLSAIRVEIGDTLAGPYCPVSAGSQTVASVGPAVRQAARDAKRVLVDIAAGFLEVPSNELDVRDGEVYARTSPGKRMAVAEVVRRIGHFQIIGKGARGPNPSDVDIRTFGAQFAEVEVDTETGEVELKRLVAVHECGRVIDPLTASSQVEGGVTQGIGYGLTEARVVDWQTGKVLNPNLEDYKIPTVLDIPPIEVTLMDHVDTRANPIGAKGLGEPPIIPTAPAIVNAVSHALGIRFNEFPLTRDRIIQALRVNVGDDVVPEPSGRPIGDAEFGASSEKPKRRVWPTEPAEGSD